MVLQLQEAGLLQNYEKGSAFDKLRLYQRFIKFCYSKAKDPLFLPVKETQKKRIIRLKSLAIKIALLMHGKDSSQIDIILP